MPLRTFEGSRSYVYESESESESESDLVNSPDELLSELSIDPSQEELMSVIHHLRAENHAKNEEIKERKKKYKRARERRHSADCVGLKEEHEELQESHEELQEDYKQLEASYKRATKTITVEAYNKNFQRATDAELELITTQNDLKDAQKEIATLKGLVFTKPTSQFQFQTTNVSPAHYTASAPVQAGTDMSVPQPQTPANITVQQDVEMQDGDVDMEDSSQMTKCHKCNYGAGMCRNARLGQACKDGFHTPKAVAAARNPQETCSFAFA